MIQPTIGRVVLVYRGESDQAEPGLVSYVYNNKRINVCGFDHYGKPFSVESIQLLQDDDTPKDPLLYAEWMPHQKAHAEKAKNIKRLRKRKLRVNRRD